jgi:amphi-Trp domain-containing protein
VKSVKKKTISRDIEKGYPRNEFIKKLRRFADALEKGKKYRIQVKGEVIDIPQEAIVNMEHERTNKEEELEFQIKWRK